MTTLTRTGLRAALVAVVISSWWTSANAQLTPAGTPIQSRASVNYSVGGQPQTLIESSPTGNTAPGAGLGAEHDVPRRQPRRPHGRGAVRQCDDHVAGRDQRRACVHGHEHR